MSSMYLPQVVALGASQTTALAGAFGLSVGPTRARTILSL